MPELISTKLAPGLHCPHCWTEVTLSLSVDGAPLAECALIVTECCARLVTYDAERHAFLPAGVGDEFRAWVEHGDMLTVLARRARKRRAKG